MHVEDDARTGGAGSRVVRGHQPLDAAWSVQCGAAIVVRRDTTTKDLERERRIEAQERRGHSSLRSSTLRLGDGTGTARFSSSDERRERGRRTLEQRRERSGVPELPEDEALLPPDGTTVDHAGHLVNRDTDPFIAPQDRPSHRLWASPRRQERRVDVPSPEAGRGEDVDADPRGVAADQEQIERTRGVPRGDPREHVYVVSSAAEDLRDLASDAETTDAHCAILSDVSRTDNGVPTRAGFWHRQSANGSSEPRNRPAPMSQPESRPSTARSVRLAVGTLGLATIAAPMLFGGVLGWTVPVIAALAALSVLASAFAGLQTSRPLPHGLLLVTLVAATLWTALQAVPLPCAITEWIAPDAFDHAMRTAELFRVEPSCTLSEDPGRTREEVLKGLALVSLFVSASLVSSVAKRETVLAIVVVACTTVALSALAHTVFAADAIWGFYEPIHGTARLGPFVNPNHLGGLMAMGAPVAFGLAASSRHRDRRLPWLLTGLLMLGVMALSLSRGAVLAVVVGLALFGALQARTQAGRARSDGRTFFDELLLRPATMAVLPLALGVVVIVASAGIDAVTRDLGDTEHGKLDVALRALTMSVTGPWVGVGRGAFAVAFLERADTGRVRYEYAESFPAQWAVDWGIVVGPVVVCALGYVVVRAIVQADRPHLFGGLAGLVAYAVQNLVDFGMEMLGSAAVGVVLLAGAATGHLSSSAVETSAVRRSVALAVTTGALTLIAVATLGRAVHGQRVEVARADLERALTSDDRIAFADAAADAATAHPREPAFPLLAGAESARHDERRALAFLNRAMVLAPTWIAPRMVAARYLATHGHFDQGLLEMREALERDPELAGSEACRLLQARPSAETLLRMAARNEHRMTSLSSLVGCLPPDAPNADEVDVALLEMEPRMVEPRVRRIERAIRTGRLEDARTFAGEPDEAEDARVTLARARIYLATGENERARESAARAEHRLDDPWPAVAIRARAAAAARDWGATRDAIGELRGLAGSDVARLGDAEVLLGELESSGGHRGQALAAYEDAWRSFERLDALMEIARLSASLGDDARAAAAQRTLCEHDVASYCTPAP